MKYLILLFVLFTFSTNINQKPIVASYDIEPELFFIQDNRVAVDIQGKPYKGLYYNPLSNQYFIADMVEVDISTIDTNNLNTNNSIEKKYLLNTPVEETYFMYAGNLSPTQRFYTNENSNEQINVSYIKTLTPFKNSNTYIYFLEPEPRYKLDPIPVPLVIIDKKHGLHEYLFTNQQGTFSLSDYSDFILFFR